MLGRLLEKLFAKPWYEKYFGWIVLAGVLVAIALSLTIGVMQSVWFDEGYSIWLAKQPIAELLRLTSLDTHPPFYYLLLKGWAGIFGWDEFALRSLSVLALGGSIAIGAFLVRRLFGVKAALLALTFAVFTPFLLRYGFEIRMYALASLIGVAATYVLVRAVGEKDRQRRRNFYLLYAVLVALGVYTLYYTALLWITHIVWLVWLAKSQKQPVFKQAWWLAYIGSALLFLPWLLTFLKQVGNGALAPIAQQMTVDNIVGVLSFTFLYRPTWQLDGWLSLVLVALLAVIIWAVAKAFTVVSKKEKPYLMLMAFYGLVPILLIALISLARPMYVERYLAHTLLGLVLFIAVAAFLALQRLKSGYVVPTAFVAVLLFGTAQLAVVGNYNFQRLHKPLIEEAAQTISCDDTVLAADPYVAIELAYYLPDCNVHVYSETADLKGGYAPLANSNLLISDPEHELAQNKKITFVYYDEPKVPMPAHLNETTKFSFGPLHVAEYK